MWKEAAVAYFEALFQNYPGGEWMDRFVGAWADRERNR
jgi:hypothetical protein